MPEDGFCPNFRHSNVNMKFIWDPLKTVFGGPLAYYSNFSVFFKRRSLDEDPTLISYAPLFAFHFFAATL